MIDLQEGTDAIGAQGGRDNKRRLPLTDGRPVQSPANLPEADAPLQTAKTIAVI